MKTLINSLVKRMGKSSDTKISREEIFLLSQEYNLKETDGIEKILFSYLESIKNDYSDKYDEIKNRISEIKSSNISEAEIYDLLVDVLDEILEK